MMPVSYTDHNLFDTIDPMLCSRATPPPRRSATSKLLAFTLITASAIYYLTTDDAAPSSAHIFNDHRFTPFTLVDREPVSATSFVLTLHPATTTLPPSEVAAQLAAPWTANDLWSLEVKQPQLQIAREYTPLPNAPPGALRFLVRAINGGEVSTYLSRLPLGATIDLRGPHGSFDLQARLRPEGRLVFLAGGTGIASALQAAHSVLDRTDSRHPAVTILWAVRARDEIQATQAAAAAAAAGPASPRRPWWNPFRAAAPEPELLTPDIAAPTQTTRDLLALQSRHPSLHVHFFVDGDTPPLAAAALAATLRAAPPASHNDTCALHAQTRHVAVADGGPNAGTRSRFPAGACACAGAGAGADAGASPPGKNLLLVSGPDGFVAALAGAKPWRGGGQVQGRVGGVLGELERREGGLLRDWLVLKL
ncbi:hypothetical protein ACHAQF_004916 [Verticillium nonalfalfae]